MFTKRFKIFSLLGFPIYLDLSWFAIAILISWSLATGYFPQQIEGLTSALYWTMGVAGAIGLFASILAHELGHAVVARRFDLHMRSITLFIFGGVAEMSEAPPSAKSEFYVAIAGPIVSIFIAVGCLALGVFSGDVMPESAAAVIAYLGMINGVLVVFNMIPAFPLDGGRVLRSILWHIKGNLRWATRISSSLGSAFGLALIVFGLMNLLTGNVIGAIWQALIGMFLRNAAQSSYQQVLVRQALEGEPVSRFMEPNVVTVDPSLSVEELVESYVYRLHHKMFPVTDNGRLLGCVTTRDVQNVPRNEWATTTVASISRECENDNTIAPASDAMQALAKMSQAGVSRMMVVDNEHLVGLLSLSDLLKFIALKVELEEDGLPSQKRAGGVSRSVEKHEGSPNDGFVEAP
ncbi:MAG: site-2 protease family protein [Planctomycetales bacterium]|nr:site-2 protease family protein [Planctomycetales bacterium]